RSALRRWRARRCCRELVTNPGSRATSRSSRRTRICSRNNFVWRKRRARSSVRVPSSIVPSAVAGSRSQETHVPKPMKRKVYEQELTKLQAKLCGLQEWVKAKGLRVIVVFEGRDAAGKGGTIKALTERVSPRVFRLAALPAPSDRE